MEKSKWLRDANEEQIDNIVETVYTIIEKHRKQYLASIPRGFFESLPDVIKIKDEDDWLEYAFVNLFDNDTAYDFDIFKEKFPSVIRKYTEIRTKLQSSFENLAINLTKYGITFEKKPKGYSTSMSNWFEWQTAFTDIVDLGGCSIGISPGDNHDLTISFLGSNYAKSEYREWLTNNITKLDI